MKDAEPFELYEKLVGTIDDIGIVISGVGYSYKRRNSFRFGVLTFVGILVAAVGTTLGTALVDRNRSAGLLGTKAGRTTELRRYECLEDMVQHACFNGLSWKSA